MAPRGGLLSTQGGRGSAPDTPGGLSDILNGELDSDLFESPSPAGAGAGAAKRAQGQRGQGQGASGDPLEDDDAEDGSGSDGGLPPAPG